MLWRSAWTLIGWRAPFRRPAGGAFAPCSRVEGVALQGAETPEVSDPAVALKGPTERPELDPVQVPSMPAPAVTPNDAVDEARLEAGLETFSRFLYARRIFTEVHSLPTSDALAFVLHTSASPMVFAYRPAAGGFERVSVMDPFTRFSSGFECWAADLLALFEGRLAASALCYTGRLRCWNETPDRLRVSPQLLWLFSHPLHRPQVARRLYDHVAESCGDVPVGILPR